jgi:hypothetical protein
MIDKKNLSKRAIGTKLISPAIEKLDGINPHNSWRKFRSLMEKFMSGENLLHVVPENGQTIFQKSIRGSFEKVF